MPELRIYNKNRYNYDWKIVASLTPAPDVKIPQLLNATNHWALPGHGMAKSNDEGAAFAYITSVP
ncbi:predicted protein [Botrytis cinerea T4]|uniref:Uncharacterized protein n=1 Tax=Botryotinia fuckeliana (strain T4) TaxID=999810 RepID=G2Y296_BOTF4|nr:predicted protein [Botrytis cinerea T4]